MSENSENETVRNRDSKANKCQPEVSTSCGIGSWRPEWLQMCASPVSFLVSVSMVAIFQAMAGSLIYPTTSTLEKRYAFDSKVSSIIFIADSILWVILSPVVGYYALRFNRARVVGVGQLILSAMCFLNAFPYFIYGPATHLLESSFTPSFADQYNSTHTEKFEMCTSGSNSTHTDHCNGQNTVNTVWPAVIILFVSNFFRGIGSVVYFVIALPFVDDNVSKKNSPIYISVMHTILLIGPMLGFLLAAYCLRFYEDPWNDPGLNRNDPHFVGAWWLAYIIAGFLNLITALPMFLYPAQFKTASIKTTTIKKKLKESGGTKEAIMRLVQNPLVILYTFGNTFRYFGTVGFYMLLTKYIETQYRQSSSHASLITGSASIAPLSVGILVGGLFIACFKPNTRLLFTLVFLAELSTFFTTGSTLFLGCEPIKLSGQTVSQASGSMSFVLESKCNRDCHCSTQVFTPICGPDQTTTYFSPCHAGCKEFNSSSLTFDDCSCVNGTATKGYCPTDQSCPNLNKFLVLLTIGAFVQATAKTGNSLITFRTVEPMDKSFANGVLASLVSIISFVPSPLLYGYITDSVCLVWEQKCGKRGNCWVYDQDKLRNTFLGVTVIFLALGSLFDFIMIFFAHRITDLYTDEATTQETDIALESIPKGLIEKS